MTAATWARNISAITSPFIVIPILSMVVIGVYSATFFEALKWSVLFFAVGMLPTVLYIIHGVRTGHITDMHIRLRSQRTGPFVVAIASMATLTVMYNLLDAPQSLQSMVNTLIVTGVILGIITHYWKASIHAGTWVGGSIILADLVSTVWLYLLLFTPAIIWARRYRGRHSFWQGVVASLVVAVSVQILLKSFESLA